MLTYSVLAVNCALACVLVLTHDVSEDSTVIIVARCCHPIHLWVKTKYSELFLGSIYG
jgi:hypothetical protein